MGWTRNLQEKKRSLFKERDDDYSGLHTRRRLLPRTVPRVKGVLLLEVYYYLLLLQVGYELDGLTKFAISSRPTDL